jgi:MFS family permease
MNITRKQLIALFVCSLVPWTVGNGLIPLLPVYAAKLGADSAVAGYYLGFSYLALALGALSAGWVSGKLPRLKLLLLITTVIAIPAAWLMGQASTVGGLTAFTAILWYFGGMEMVLLGILTGLSAGVQERGKIYGLLGLTNGLGALVGGLGIGWLVDRLGYPSMFNIIAACMVIGPLSAILIEDKKLSQTDSEQIPSQRLPGMGKNFYLLFASCILISMTSFFVLLIRSIVMDDLNFAPLAISSTGAIGGLVAMPFPFLMGWFSDRIGRKTLIFAGYLTGLASLIIIAFSRQLWHFGLAIAVNGIAMGSNSIGNALVNDLVPPPSLGKALSIFGAAVWIGGVAGFAVAGAALQNLGFTPTIIIGGCLAVASLALLIPLRGRSQITRHHEAA